MSVGSTNIVSVDDDNFEIEDLRAEQPVLVDFWAEWCGPCKTISPILNEIAHHYINCLKVVNINIDHYPKTPEKYGVRGIPTLMLFKTGQIEDTKVGAMSKSQLSSF